MSHEPPRYDIARGLENLNRMVPAQGSQREQFDTLATTTQGIVQDIQQHGITPENTLAWQQALYQLHVIGFQLHPPVTFNDLCRTDRDYSRLAHDRAERPLETHQDTFGR